MEASKGKFLCSYLKKFKMLLFSSFLIQNWRKGGQKRSCLGGGDWYQWEGGGDGERVKRGVYGENTVYTCMEMENDIC
jgi:hypothetical protein